jgi:hypothetical protein
VIIDIVGLVSAAADIVAAGADAGLQAGAVVVVVVDIGGAAIDGRGTKGPAALVEGEGFENVVRPLFPVKF